MKVSIITPTLNPNPCYLSQCINSVLDQKEDTEHIFVDGGSTNGTIEFITEYQRLFPQRVRIIVGKDNSAGEAWVKGIWLATGDVFGWLGADDTLMPNAVNIVLEFFSDNPFADFVFGGCNRIDVAGKFLTRIRTKEFDLHDAVNNYCSIPATSAFYRRTVIEQVNPDIISKNDGELEYWLMVGKRFKLWRIDPVLSNFRLYDGKMGSGKKRKDGLYEYASTVWRINRRQGAGLLSPCAIRYYLSLVTLPISPILNPVFKKVTQRK